jgi:hypothetical protein
LIEHLTSAGAIYGDGTGACLARGLRGIDPGLLRIEARFSHEKRMEKIAAVFPRTIALLGNDRGHFIKEFTRACPPTDISRIENARQFHEFLLLHWQREPPAPAYLPDVAAWELAFARVRIAADRPAAEPIPPDKGMRRRPDVVLLRCAFDIHPVFEAGGGDGAPIARDTPLAIAIDPQTQEPRILELAPEVFDLLAALGDWTDPAAFAGPSEADLVTALADAGVLELRR